MSKFNVKSTGTKTKNLAGGEAYSQKPELELVSIMLTSFAKDEYYRSGNDTFEKIKSLISKVGAEFAAKAAIYARTEFGMRSITHVLASELAKHASGKSWAKKFYEKIVYRPDDMMEILSYHTKVNGKITSAMKEGFSKAFNKFDKYQLAKYRGEGKDFKLIDVVNLVHPNPSERNIEALNLLVGGKLKSEGAWESELTKAGQKEGDKEEFKKEVWTKLLNERKIGYFALLRNLRNILEQAPEMIDKACELLTDESLIRKSLVLPFRYITALEQFDTNSDARKILIALNKAVDISCKNVPKFSGRSLVVCDYSGSMGSGYNSNKYKGSLFGSIFAKANDSDFMIFGDRAEYVNFNPMDSTLSITKQTVALNNTYGLGSSSIGNVGHGTNFHSIFDTIDKSYDRIVIFSDMQGWIGYNSPVRAYESYKNKFNANPFIYSFDLSGYGTMQFPQSKVYCLAGFSEKVFDLMKLLEVDKNALINKINEISL